jgi:hypothetical protein
MKLESPDPSAAGIGLGTILAAVLLIAPATSAAQGKAGATSAPPPAATAPAALTTDSQREAAAVLRRMAEYLAGLPSFSCRVRNGYDVVQQDGRKVEFGATRALTVARPGRLRSEEVSSDGVRDLAIFDGRNMTVLDADEGVYAQVPQPATVDDALVYFVRDLRMRMPLAILLSSRLPAELPGRITAIDYVELTDIYGFAAHHVTGSTEAVDFQFWIADGERPLPMRVVLTYRDSPGQPQYWADFSDWNTSPKIADATFTFTPPSGARKVPFAVQVSAPTGARSPAATKQETKR